MRCVKRLYGAHWPSCCISLICLNRMLCGLKKIRCVCICLHGSLPPPVRGKAVRWGGHSLLTVCRVCAQEVAATFSMRARSPSTPRISTKSSRRAAFAHPSRACQRRADGARFSASSKTPLAVPTRCVCNGCGRWHGVLPLLLSPGWVPLVSTSYADALAPFAAPWQASTSSQRLRCGRIHPIAHSYFPIWLGLWGGNDNSCQLAAAAGQGHAVCSSVGRARPSRDALDSAHGSP